MSEAGVLIPTVAPGQWRTAMTPEGTRIVTATFAGSRDAAAVQAQLLSWLRAVGACVESARANGTTTPLHLPQNVTESDGAMVLAFAAPSTIGEDGLASPRTPRETLELLARLAAGLDTLHASHLVHGGLGLTSLWWMPDGSVVFPDVALTHALEDVLPAPASAAGYRSPEVWRGRGHVAASDQYALAVMAFELLSGRRRLVQEDADHIVSIEPMVMEPGARLYPGAPDALNDVLQRALAASPGARYPSCTAFVEALAGHVDEVTSMPTVHRMRWISDGRASRRVMALGAVAMVSVVTALVVLRGSIEPTSLPRGLPRSLPRLDASVLPSASGSSGGEGARAPGTLPQSGGGTGSNSSNEGVRGELPRNTSTSTAGSGSVVNGRSTPGAQNNGAVPPATLQRGELANGTAIPAGGDVRLVPTTLPVNGARVPAATAPVAQVSVLDRIGGALRGMLQSTPSPTAPPAAASGTSAGTIEDAPRAASTISGSGAAPASRSGTSPARSNAPSIAIPVPTLASSRGPAPKPGASRASAPSSSPTGSSASPVSQPSRVAPAAGLSAAPTSAAPASPSAASTPSSTLGTVRLDVPRDSRIYLDGVLVRPSGNQIVIPAGSHDIDIVSGSGVRTRRRVNVAAGETITVRK